MQTTASDRDDLMTEIKQPQLPVDDLPHDVFDLWLDLGGSD